MKIEAKNRGTHLDDVLREDGILEEVTSKAVKSVLAWRISQEMKEKKYYKTCFTEKFSVA